MENKCSLGYRNALSGTIHVAISTSQYRAKLGQGTRSLVSPLSLGCGVNKTTMKTLTASPSAPPVTRVPDFGGRPRRINLDQIVAVKGHGKLNIRPIRLDDEQEMIRF